MARSLSVLHLADRANVEEVENLGSPKLGDTFRLADAVDGAGLVYQLSDAAAPRSVKVVKDGVPLTLQAQRNANITDVFDGNSPGQVAFLTTKPHRFLPGDSVLISGNTGFEGVHEVLEVEPTRFEIAGTFSSTGQAVSAFVSVVGPSGGPTADLGNFRILTVVENGVEQPSQLVVATQPIDEIEVSYSTPQDYTVSVIELRGTGMGFITDMFVGNIRIPDVEIVSRKRARFRIAKEIEDSATIENIKALAAIDTPVTSDIVFDISTRSKFSRGTQMVLQRFLTVLMDPSGGNLLGLIPKGTTLTPALRSLILNRVSLSVNVTRDKIRSTTSRGSLPEETLANAVVERVSIVSAQNAAEVTIRVTTQAGQSLTAPLSLGV